jgi:hypothetical protein
MLIEMAVKADARGQGMICLYENIGGIEALGLGTQLVLAGFLPLHPLLPGILEKFGMENGALIRNQFITEGRPCSPGLQDLRGNRRNSGRFRRQFDLVYGRQFALYPPIMQKPTLVGTQGGPAGQGQGQNRGKAYSHFHPRTRVAFLAFVLNAYGIYGLGNNRAAPIFSKLLIVFWCTVRNLMYLIVNLNII